MFGFVTSLFKKDPREVTLNEFRKIRDLKVKLDALSVTDELQKEMKETQYAVLLNNFEAVAHTFQLKNELPVYQKDGLLNLQSTDKKVYTLNDMNSWSEAVLTEFEPRIRHVDPGLTSKLDFDLEKKFLLLSRPVKKSILENIRERIEKKVKLKAIELAEATPYNEDVFYEFIIDNFGEDSFNIDTIEERYDFIYFLYTEFAFTEDFEIGVKDILVFKPERYDSDRLNIRKLVEKLKSQRYDFVLMSDRPATRMVHE